MNAEQPGHPDAVARRQLTADAHRWRELQAAPVLLVLHADGRAELSVADSVDDLALSRYVESVAGMIARGEHRQSCTACAEGAEHDHGVPSAHEPDTDPPAPAASPAPG